MTEHGRGLKAWRAEAGFAQRLFLKMQEVLVQRPASRSLKEASGHFPRRVSVSLLVCLLLPSGPAHFLSPHCTRHSSRPCSGSQTHAVFPYWKGCGENLLRPFGQTRELLLTELILELGRYRNRSGRSGHN